MTSVQNTPMPPINIHKRNANGHQTLKNIHHANKKCFGGCFQWQVTEDPIQTGLNSKRIISLITRSPEVG